MSVLYIGVIGHYPPSRFDEEKACHLLNDAFDNVITDHPDADEVWVVSRHVDAGISAIAYRIARERHRNEEYRSWHTMGITRAHAPEYPLFDVDVSRIIGDEEDQGSGILLAAIDVLVRIGTSKQLLEETEAFAAMRGNDRVYAYELAAF